ncbi:MAG: amylo-alpha-1,6-glucosidase, partial [Acidimicrobiia bacterium]|nr:amylo-alpha-1,6-glucosidase [Acidimicrobiia bacterium]
VTSDDNDLNRSLQGAFWDLEALTVSDPTTGRPFIAAGAPHFLAVFGRDALVVSLLSLLRGTEPALSVLDVLAAHQGTVDDPRTVESPGRILHELRIGEMGVFGLEPGEPYFGSVDATPLFVVLLAECLRWGAEADRLGPLIPAARACLDWCRQHVDELGFVRSIPHPTGIGNQGWKDSGDSMVTADGATLEEQTSLAEVQGYVHEALIGMAELEEHLGDASQASSLLDEAEQLRLRFLQHFAVDEPVHVAPWLDATGSPVSVRASNVGHLLAGTLLDDDLAGRLCDRLLDPAEFSGWGIRTLAATEHAYNPLGYHLGTVWPHDTALAMRGMARRGRGTDAQRLSRALLELSRAEGDQLPELLGGFDRHDIPTPVPYPASARPQAWAAAVPIQVTAVRLGIEPSMHRGRLRFRPLLGDDEWIDVRGLVLGSRRLNIFARGTEVEVTGDVHGLQIDVIDDSTDRSGPV